ncbi:MAG: DinB family protein, partial [Chitinophagaceae bacterium]
MPRPDLQTVPEFFQKYVNKVQNEDVKKAIEDNTEETVRFLQAISDEKWSYRYAEGKWSIKEMIQHIIDGERIFSYRALCFARGEKTSLPGFDENDYADA